MGYADVDSSHLFLYVINGRGSATQITTGGEYSIDFKVPASREEIGDSLDKYSINCDISPNYQLFIKGEGEIRLLLEGRRIVS